MVQVCLQCIGLKWLLFGLPLPDNAGMVFLPGRLLRLELQCCVSPLFRLQPRHIPVYVRMFAADRLLETSMPGLQIIISSPWPILETPQSRWHS